MRAKINLLFYVVCLSILICSCGEKSCYRHEVREVNFLTDNMPTVQGEEIELDAMGCDDIIIYDSLIIVLTNNPAHHIQVFSLNSYTQLANIAPSGRAKSEVASGILTNTSKQIYERDGHIIMPVVDYSILKEIDITASIEQQRTVMISAENCLSIEEGNFVLLNNNNVDKFEYKYSFPGTIHKSILIGRYFLTDVEETKEISVYRKPMNGMDSEGTRSRYVDGILSKHPHRNIVIQPLSYMDYVLVFDLDNQKYYALHQQNTDSFDSLVPIDWGFKFSDCTTTNSFFIVTYDIGMKTDAVVMVDWDGNCLGSFMLGNVVQRIAYDERSNVLYGINRLTDKIYKFNLNGIL